MALDEALLESVISGSPPVLRLYRWTPPTISLGYAQRGENVVNRRACRELGFDIVRRITGGRAVLHDREVTYAIISSETSDVFSGGILDNYRIIAHVLKNALESFGLAVVMTPGRSRGGGGQTPHGVCFVAPSSYELVHRGHKMVGSSQKRQGGAFLQHGSIPVEMDVEALFRALDHSGSVSTVEGGKLLSEKIGWMNRWLAAPVTVDEVEARLVSAFEELLGITFDESVPTDGELKRAEELRKERYSNPSWTFQGYSTRREDSATKND